MSIPYVSTSASASNSRATSGFGEKTYVQQIAELKKVGLAMGMSEYHAKEYAKKERKIIKEHNKKTLKQQEQVECIKTRLDILSEMTHENFKMNEYMNRMIYEITHIVDSIEK